MTVAMSPGQWVQKIALGTVQFGMDYGVSNQTGKVAEDEVLAILRRAHAAGMRVLDTARIYGDSEAVLGRTLYGTNLDFGVVSKLPPECPASEVPDRIEDSIDQLGYSMLYGYLAHSFADFEKPELRNALIDARQRGTVRKIGVSLYFPGEAEWMLDHDIDVDLVQLPFNVFDQRFAEVLPRLRARGVEVHARSAYLQGLFFLEPEVVQRKFPSAYPRFYEFRRLCERNDLTTGAALLNFVLRQSDIDKVVIGVTSLAELNANLESYEQFERGREVQQALSELSLDDEQVILPFNWS